MKKTFKKVEWYENEIDLALKQMTPKETVQIAEAYMTAGSLFGEFLKKTEDFNGKNISLVKTVFLQLLNGDPLTPIEDNDEEWELVEGSTGPECVIYQSKRRKSLFKKVDETKDSEPPKFTDTARAVCMDINNTDLIYTGGMGPIVLDETVPIEMPYSPSGKIKIFTEEFKCHKDCKGDSDTIGVLYFRMPDGRIKTVKRFFKEDPKAHKMIEIDISEYFKRKKKAGIY